VAKVHAEDREVLGLTVGVAGLVDPGGVVRLAPNLGWHDLSLRDSLVQALDGPAFPVSVENEANLAARAEHRYGPYAGVGNLVYLNGHAGVGAGIIADGHLLRGGLGYSGEIGHVQVDPNGPVCGCGRTGCLEAVAGIEALVRRVGGADPTDLEPEVNDIVRRAKAGEPAVIGALREMGRHIGFGTSVLSNVVNPEVVILGGYFVPLAPWILPAAERQLHERTAAPDAGGCRITASTLGHGAAATGGAASILDSVDSGTLPAPQKVRVSDTGARFARTGPGPT
jgi:predicted NBD/HSP70 family sugar kinase